MLWAQKVSKLLCRLLIGLPYGTGGHTTVGRIITTKHNRTKPTSYYVHHVFPKENANPLRVHTSLTREQFQFHRSSAHVTRRKRKWTLVVALFVLAWCLIGSVGSTDGRSRDLREVKDAPTVHCAPIGRRQVPTSCVSCT